MREPDGGLGLVDVLAAGAARRRRLQLHVPLREHDLDLEALLISSGSETRRGWTLGGSGRTATEAVEVCVRPPLSVAGTRCTLQAANRMAGKG